MSQEAPKKKKQTKEGSFKITIQYQTWQLFAEPCHKPSVHSALRALRADHIAATQVLVAVQQVGVSPPGCAAG